MAPRQSQKMLTILLVVFPALCLCENTSTCDPGTFLIQESLSCLPCRPGSYSVEPDTPICFSCMRGSFASDHGSTVCRLSGMGTYVARSGQTSSAVCEPGTFQFMGGSSACIACAPGHYQTGSGSTACNACLPGSQQSLSGGPVCQACEPGSYSWSSGSTACIDCGIGLFQPDNSSTACSACAPGTVQPLSGQGACDDCLAGKYQTGEGTPQCVTCKRGEFQSAQGSTHCLECQRGTYQSTTGSQTRDDCVGCKPGTFNPSEGGESENACLPCDSGSYSRFPAAILCDACEPGTLQNLQHATSCVDCQAGTFLTATGWPLETCEACGPGLFSTAIGANQESTCELCQQGHFSTSLGASHAHACQPCPTGTISSGEGSSCLACPLDTFCPSGSSVPIACTDERLACNGTHLLAIPGFLPVVRATEDGQQHCTGVIPCPPGTECHAHPDAGGDWEIQVATSQTHFVVFEEGPNQTSMSGCANPTPLSYGYARVDWPHYQHPTEGHRILFRLLPEGCLPGGFLQGSTCEPCPPGTFSADYGALDWSACSACPEGTFAANPGSTACVSCSAGMYQDSPGGTACASCPTGAFQGYEGATACILCSAGTYSNTTETDQCGACPAGSAQALPGQTSCQPCNEQQFSSPGDSLCSPCGVTPRNAPGLSECQDLGKLPSQTDSVWLSVRGEFGDECVAMDVSRIEQAPSSTTGLTIGTQPMTGQASCVHTLHIMGRPDLSRTWTSRQNLLYRPVLLEVLPHDLWTYPVVCQSNGMGVSYLVRDHQGGTVVDLLGAELIMSFVDPQTDDLLYWTTCNGLPRLIPGTTGIALGYCHTTAFCPTTDVRATITLSWPGGGSVSGHADLGVRAYTPCAPSTDWMAHVELVEPGRPVFPNDLIDIRIRVSDPPGEIVGFSFQLGILPGIHFKSFQSPFKVTSNLENGVLFVQGDTSGGTLDPSGILGHLLLENRLTAMGPLGIVHVVENSFKCTVERASSFEIPVKTQGFTCGKGGQLEALMDFTRIISLTAQPIMSRMVRWQSIQSTAQSFPNSVEVVGIWNSLGEASAVQASCSAGNHLTILNCKDIQAGGDHGGGKAEIQVETLTASTTTSVEVFVPTLARVDTIVALDGMSGRFKVFVNLTQQGVDAFEKLVDATPFLSNQETIAASGGVTVSGEEWTCPTIPGDAPIMSFTVGSPVLFHGECTPNQATYRGGLIPFLFTGGLGSLGYFAFSRSVIHPLTAQGVILLLTSDKGLLWSGSNAPKMETLDGRLQISQDHLELGANAMSARCVPVSIPGIQAPLLIPVIPASPSSLVVVMSAYVLVTQHDIWEMMPSQANILKAWVGKSDGSIENLLGDPRLSMATQGDLEIKQGVGVESRTTTGEFNLIFTVDGMPCLSYEVSIRVHPYSVKSSSLECPLCPPILTLEDDPITKAFPDMFPSSIPTSLFVLRCTLADDSERVTKPSDLISEGTATLVNGLVIGKAEGVATITTPLARNALHIQVIRRWVKDYHLLCNGMGCADPGVKLAPPGDGASLSPFLYSTQLDVSMSLTLANETVITSPILHGMDFLVNNTKSPSVFSPLHPGALELAVSISDDAWQLEPIKTYPVHVQTVQTVKLSGPLVLYQIHCSGVWEMGTYLATARLTDGAEAEVQAALIADGNILHLHEPSRDTFYPGEAGDGWIHVVFGRFVEHHLIVATPGSRFLFGVSMDFIPYNWTARADQPLWIPPLRSLLDPAFSVHFPDLLRERVLRWETAPAQGVISWDSTFSSLTLLSDYYAPLAVTSTLLACLPSRAEVRTTRYIQVNLAPATPGQIDLGEEQGAPLAQSVGTGETIPIPVYMFAQQPLKLYLVNAQVEIMALFPESCLPGEFPTSQCQITSFTNGTFQMSGQFPESHRTGRIHVGTLLCRVRLEALTRIRVTTQDSTYEFSVMLGAAHTLDLLPPPHQPFLNRILPAGVLQSVQPILLSEEDPTDLVVCCDITISKRSAGLGRLFPSIFSLARIAVMWGETKSVLDIMDPRLHLFYDKTLLSFDGYGAWRVLENGEWTSSGDTTMELVYRQPDSNSSWLQAQITVTLAEVDQLVLSPDHAITLSRVHCSPIVFQDASVTPSIILKNGRGTLSLEETDDQFWVKPSNTDTILTSLVHLPHTSIRVTGLSPGISIIEAGFNQARTTLQVSVLDDSVLLSRLEFQSPLELAACKNTPIPVPVSASFPDGTPVQGLHRFGAGISHLSGPVSLVPTGSSLEVAVQGNSAWGDLEAGSVTVTLPACNAGVDSIHTSPFTARVLPCITSSQLADLEVILFEDRAELTLVGQGILAFYVHIRTSQSSNASSMSCALTTLDPSTSDCVTVDKSDGIDVLVAGTTPISSSDRHPLATLRPRPDKLWGFIEITTDVSPALRFPIISGQTGALMPAAPFDPVVALMPDLPIVDTTTLARQFSMDTLYLMTGRKRRVETSVYSNYRELSIMFRVTDRFLVPDVNSTRITCLIHDPLRSLPHLPGAIIDKEEGTQTVLAVPIADGWYAVQSEDSPDTPTIPQMDIRFEISVQTPSSLSPWTIPVAPVPFLIGRLLYDCPRSTYDPARFVAVFQVELPWPPSQQLIQQVGCRVHVVARRIIFASEAPLPTTNYTLSIQVESFIRLHHVREAFSDPTWFLDLASADRPSTPIEAIRTWADQRRRVLVRRETASISALNPELMVYVNDTEDPNATFCPPGMYFSANGTYESLPQHSQSGPDCYGMLCVDGYELLSGQPEGSPPLCIPSSVSNEVIWVCVITILSLIAFVMSILCCVRLSRGVHPAVPAPSLPAPPATAPALSDASLHPLPHEWGVMALSDVRLDDYSTMILEGEFSPIAREGQAQHCRVY